MAGGRCDHVRKMLSSYLDGELGPREHILVQDHLQECAACAAELEALAATSRLVARLPEEELPEGFHASLTGRLKAATQARPLPRSEAGGAARRVRAGREAGGTAGLLDRAADGLRGFGLGLSRRPLRGLAAAAAVVVLVLFAWNFAFHMGVPVPGGDLIGQRRRHR